MTILRGIYAIVDPRAHDDVDRFTEALLRGGIRLVQVRDKAGASPHDVDRLHALCRRYRAILIVNDDPYLALRADGVHLGQSDLLRHSLAEVRAFLGARIVGISASTPEQARLAWRQGADYLGTGPFAATRSKEDARDPIGTRGLREAAQSTPLPVAAIGGITLDGLAEVAAAGAKMAAVLSALASAEDPAAQAAAMVRRWDELTR